PEIFRDYKSGAIGAAREEEDAFAGGGKGLAVSATHAERLPLRECRPAAHVVEAFWHRDLEAPWQRRIPVPFAQVVGCGSENVRNVAPDIGAAVTRKVGSIVNEIRRHELRLTHGAGP